MPEQTVELALPRIRSICVGALETYRLPGLAVGIVRGDGLAWSGGFGFSDIPSLRKPDERTISRVASITKTFTTLAILQLRDDGMLELDDPLVLHIPEFSAVVPTAGRTEDVTLKRLLTHRSGLPTEPPLPGWDTLDFPSAEAIIGALSQVEVVIPQDSAFKYSNFAFALLGEVVSRLTGRLYADYIRDNIFDPLGMTDSGFEPTSHIKSLMATGYSPAEFEEDPVAAPYAHLRGMTSAGQLHSNVRDLAKWVSFQFKTGIEARSGAQVLDGRSLQEMHRPVYIEPDWSAGQALGWRATRRGDRVYHNHGGGIHGFGSNIMFNGPSKTGAVVLANIFPTNAAQAVASDILDAVLDADAVAAKNAPRQEAAAPGPVPEALAGYLGRYRAEPGIPALVEYRVGSLRISDPVPGQYGLHGGGILELTAEENTFRVRGGRGSGEKAFFKRDNNGRVSSYSLGGFNFIRQV